MATNNTVKNQLSKKQDGNSPGNSLKALLNSDGLKKRFEQILDKRAPQYMSSILNLYNSEKSLQNVDPMSVVSSAMVAATLDMPIDKNLGYAWIVPYKGRAQFQMGYKGYIQLALRTGKYKSINVIEVYEGELIKWDRFTEELELDLENKQSDAVIGYAGYFKLVNGFEKKVYWTKEEIETHKKKFSKSDFGWKKDYDAMAKKTVLRNMLSKWGILSVEMQNAYSEEISIESGNKPETDDNVIDLYSNDEEEADQNKESDDSKEGSDEKADEENNAEDDIDANDELQSLIDDESIIK